MTRKKITDELEFVNEERSESGSWAYIDSSRF
jgi:hypothetical protein